MAATKRQLRLGAALTLSALTLSLACSSDDGPEPGSGAGGSGAAGAGGAIAGSGGTAGARVDDAGKDVSDVDAGDGDGQANDGSTGAVDGAADVDVAPAPCSEDMVEVGETCVDRYEAPNRVGALPFVMYSWYEARDWCEARDKRLCFDDEWRSACEGTDKLSYPYGDVQTPGICHDEERWRAYDQSLLNLWPRRLAAPDVESVEELWSRGRALGANATRAVDHVVSLYQASGGGDYVGCGGEYGVFDLVGNVEEWVQRRNPGTGYQSGLKGRFWAESRTCQGTITVHGEAFRFYEIGFRCCRDAERADR